MGDILNYIKQEILCNDIRIELFHFKGDGEEAKLAVDPDFKAAVAKHAFRWKTLQNDPVTGKRA